MPEQPPAAGVAAVVLTWRDRTQTAECVRTLLRSPLIGRIVVVDNEADGTIAAALPSDARIEVHEIAANTGFAGGVNVGLKTVLDDPTTRLVLAVNNDATLSPDSLAALVAALDGDPGLSMVAPGISTPEGERSTAGGVVNRITWSIREPRPGERPDYLTWACVLVRPEVFATVGLLDERFFMYWEDVEFALRMTDHGLRFAEVPEAVLVHAVSSSHSRAGSRVLAYSSEAFRHFLRLRGGRTTVLGLGRLATKVLVTAATGDLRGARYVVAGWRIGRRAPDPAYPALARLP